MPGADPLGGIRESPGFLRLAETEIEKWNKTGAHGTDDRVKGLWARAPTTPPVAASSLVPAERSKRAGKSMPKLGTERKLGMTIELLIRS